VKGLDIGDDDDFNGSNKNFGLRPSVDSKSMKKKKRMCVLIWGQMHNLFDLFLIFYALISVKDSQVH